MDTNNIMANSADISLVDNASAQTSFCSIWPNVKAGLTVLQGLIKNPPLKAVIGVVIAAGDAVSSRICG